MERILTDVRGDRWDVSQQHGNGSEEYRIEFRRQTGEQHAVDSKLGVNELSDRQLLEMLEGQAGSEGVTHGRERTSDPDGYISR